MARPTNESNEIILKIENVFAVYGKNLPPAAIKIWMEQLANYSTQEILKAFDDHVAGKSVTESGNHSRYAPKPIHILEHIRSARDRKKSFQKKQDEQNEKPCDPKIAKAWHLFITQIQGVGMLSDYTDPKNNIRLTRDEVIEIVNREAAKYDMPDAIPPAYRLREFWPDDSAFAF